ncbi:oxygenase MpaB family protein [Streptomyces physcomitrii]|uniref:oxygenase MpaB family protein n=1 Tax=Streptomyces physcomitrii TaxID=2724184 RepID=UPI0033E21A0B
MSENGGATGGPESAPEDGARGGPKSGSGPRLPGRARGLRPWDRDHWPRRIALLDPEEDYEEIYRITSLHEFPWDMSQALSFALYRTYAVPSIGELLAATGEFTGRTRKRYEDTALLLEAPVEHGGDSPEGREAVRRINRMHRAYDIPEEDFRYVLATFVVVPKRWLDDYGHRPLSPAELRAATRYYQVLGARMGIKDIPAGYQEFEELLDAYERRHFAYSEGGRAVADATLRLMRSWYPRPVRPLMGLAARCLLDAPLREAFRYPAPPALLSALVRRGLWLRGRFAGLLPPRRKPLHIRETARIRGYPHGYALADLGTFPGGCPVPHQDQGGQEQRLPGGPAS